MDTEELEVRTSRSSRTHHTHLYLLSLQDPPSSLGGIELSGFQRRLSGVKTWLLPNDSASLFTCIPASGGSHVLRAQAL